MNSNNHETDFPLTSVEEIQRQVDAVVINDTCCCGEAHCEKCMLVEMFEISCHEQYVYDLLRHVKKERDDNARLRETLELIAAPMRPDGTWNRDRQACAELALAVLEGK